MPGRRELLAAFGVDRFGLSGMHPGRSQVSQGAVESFVIIPVDDLIRGTSSLPERLEFVFAERNAEGAHHALHIPILFGRVRPDPVVIRPMLAEHAAEVSADEGAPVVALDAHLASQMCRQRLQRTLSSERNARTVHRAQQLMIDYKAAEDIREDQ